MSLSQYDTREQAEKEGAVVAKIIFDNVTLEQVIQIISDYKSYTEFVEGTNKVEYKDTVEGTDGKCLDVWWNVTVGGLKTVEYTLRLCVFEDGLSWQETDHGPFKKNRGGWKLKPTTDGKGVEATYIALIDFNVWCPGFIKDFLVGKGLTKTLEAFKKRLAEKFKN
ncbi:predicted protein [Naegleria gruberi]|uniref:Predicted protein n=1 Tax=Naegleria gruberi TaxID=5762 RepID=D2VKP9_NAEGR|nr:uncharacterized protein NAEGRDRAFT_69470 [Naegleria gruberi]EFC42632.1 predicted protein [Naegleria gruberi]|eukprot:XP_002675376.1 predicted protein [Naegleria gruberi strain NEG-M]